MNIGIDIDDTISETAKKLKVYAEKFNKEQNIVYQIDNNEGNYFKAFGWTKEQMCKFFEEYLRIMLSELAVKPGAKEIIDKLRESGNRIIIITARNKKTIDDIEEITIDWLEKAGIKFDKLIIDSKDKSKDCLDEKIDIFIDDDISNCAEVFERLKIPVFLMDSPYNKEYKNKNITRIYSWREFYYLKFPNKNNGKKAKVEEK